MLFILHAVAVNAPRWDEWRWADMVVKFDAGTLHFDDFWHQNNEHRLFVPSLIALGLSRFGGWDPRREVYFSLFLVILSQLILYRIIVRTLPQRTVAVAFLLDSLLLFSLGQSENWFYGFQIAWFSINLCLLVVVLMLCGERIGPRRAAVAAGGAIVAVLSSVFGLNVLAAGLFLVAARRPFSARAVFAWLALSVALVAVYFWRFDFHSPIAKYEDVGASLAGRILYLLTFMGSPIGRALGSTWSAVFGLAGALLVSAAFVRFARLYRRNAPEITTYAPWIATALYGVLCGCMLAAGRSAPILGPGAAATASRYVTLGTLVWISLVGFAALAWPALARLPRLATAPATVALLAACISFGLANAAGYAELEAFRDQSLVFASTIRQYRNYSDAELVTRLFPYPPLLFLIRQIDFPNPDHVRQLIERLQHYREGPFVGDA
jgi:hypothetical protein